MVAGNKMPQQLEIATDASHAWSSSRMPALLLTSCREPSSSTKPASGDVMDIHTSPPSRVSHVLTSKRTPKAAVQLKPEVVPESREPTSKNGQFVKISDKVQCALKDLQCPTKQPQPDIPIVSERRRSSGHIVIGSQRPQLFLSPRTKDAGGFDSKSQPSVDPKAQAAKDTTQATMSSFQITQPACGTSSDELQTIQSLESDISAGFQANAPPIPVDDCTGGVYYLRTKSRRIVAVFKPSDEEPYAPNNPKRYLHPPQPESSSPRPEDQQPKSHFNLTADLKSGIRVGIAAGDAAIREVAAYLLDKNRHTGVPLTVLARASHPVFHHAAGLVSSTKRQPKTGALQTYVPHKCTADDVSSSLFSIADVHAIALLDIRLANQDRHGGNILVVEQTKRVYKLVPIDHGACLPRVSEMEETSFLWLSWPQAKHPFSSDTLEYIASLDPFEECRVLQQTLPRAHQLEPQAMLTLLICTVFLQVCAIERTLSAFEIGMLMCRHGTFCQQQPEPSALEQLVRKTLEDVAVQTTDRDQCFKSVVLSFRRHLSAFLSTEKL